MKATFYNFSKKNNSTAIPSGGSETDIFLKDNCSILNPVIELHSDTRPLYTYCYIQEFTRYYFIGDWNYDRGVWIAALSVDVGASYRTQIRDYTAFVERAQSNYDGNLNDNILSVKQSLVLDTHSIHASDHIYPFQGCYVVRVCEGQSTGSSTGIGVYILTASQLGSLLSYLYNSQNFEDVLSEAFVKAVFNPMDYILSIKWFPFSPTDLPNISVSGLTPIKIAWFETTAQGYKVNNSGGYDEIIIDAGDRYYNDWRDLNSTVTNITLYVPSYGVVDIPPEAFYKAGGLRITHTFDLATGQMGISIEGKDYANDGSIFTTIVGTIGYDVQIGQINVNTMGAIDGVASVAGSVLSGNMLGAITNGISTIRNVITPMARTTGSVGAIEGFVQRPWYVLNKRVFDTAEYALTVAGRPLMQNVKLSTLTGFVKCGNASITISAYTAERDAVNSMLNNGIYIE